MDRYQMPGSLPDATASEMVQGVIITATGQVQRKNLASLSYTLEATDQHGNTVKISGEIFNRMEE